MKGVRDQAAPDGRFGFSRMIPNRWVRWSLYFAFWTVLGLLNAASAVIDVLDNPRFAPWEPLVWEMTSLYTTGLLCPLVVDLARRWRFTRSNWPPVLAGHLAAMVLFSLAHSAGMVAMRKAVYLMVGSSYSFGGKGLALQLAYEFYKDIRLYWVIVLLGLGFQYYNKYRERELEASALEARLAETQLENLKHRLNPHFLFNTLHAISSYVQSDPDKADRMIARLSDLLRMALRNAGGQEIALEEELEGLDLYIEIMRARFGDDFVFRRDIDPASHQALVPSLLLQPLVENAFRHGISKRSEGGVVEVSSRVENGTLRLRVRDNGPGSKDAVGHLAKGVGLSSSADRLRFLHGDRQSLHARTLRPDQSGPPFHDGGFEVAVEMPFRASEGRGQ